MRVAHTLTGSGPCLAENDEALGCVPLSVSAPNPLGGVHPPLPNMPVTLKVQQTLYWNLELYVMRDARKP